MYWRPVAMKTWCFLPHKGLMSRFCLLQEKFAMIFHESIQFIYVCKLTDVITAPPYCSICQLYNQASIFFPLISLASDLSLCKFSKTINFFINTFYYLFLFNLSCFLSSLLYLTKFGLILLLFFWLPRLSS